MAATDQTPETTNNLAMRDPSINGPSDNGDGYDADSIRDEMRERAIQPVIPMRKSRKKRVGVHRPLYRLRNLVERCFNKLKNARRGATRYDKTAESFLGFIDITSIRLWLRHLST